MRSATHFVAWAAIFKMDEREAEVSLAAHGAPGMAPGQMRGTGLRYLRAVRNPQYSIFIKGYPEYDDSARRGIAAWAAEGKRILIDKRFNPSQAHRLDAPERLLWLPPADILHALNLKAGESVADVGAGTGYFSLPMAKAVGNAGIVYAVDAQEEMLELLRRKRDHLLVSNIHLIHAEGDHTTLAQGSCDLVFMANVWHEFADRMVVLHEALWILKRPGRIALLDWRPNVEREAGPPLEHRISAAVAAAELRSAGFQHVTERNIGRYSWLVQGDAVVQ